MVRASEIESYWSNHAPPRIYQAIRNALGKSEGDPVSQNDMKRAAQFDHFHCLDIEATGHLAEFLGIDSSNLRIIDFGSGIGGPARYLASQYGCHVTGVDITKGYVEAARELARDVGLDDLLEFVHADATNTGLPASQFDIAWIQVSSTNIKDRGGLYSEAYRVLKSGGRIGIFDIFAGHGGEIKYPVPWADSSSTSCLLTLDETIRMLEKADFTFYGKEDATDRALEWYRKESKVVPPDASRIGFDLLLPDKHKRFQTMVTNILGDKCRVGYIIAGKKSKCH